MISSSRLSIKERCSMNKIPAALHPIRILGVFAHPGERAKSLYLLLSGTAQVIREGVDGTQQVLAHLNLGPSLVKRGAGLSANTP
jgi:hypothetical protein